MGLGILGEQKEKGGSLVGFGSKAAAGQERLPRSASKLALEVSARTCL